MWTFPFLGWEPRLAELARLPVDLACSRLWQQARWQRSVLGWLEHPGPHTLDGMLGALQDGFNGALGLPFDCARAQHAAGVLAGALPRSLLESTRFERQLGAMEWLALGPLARRV
jgi:hypothetical protein